MRRLHLERLVWAVLVGVVVFVLSLIFFPDNARSIGAILALVAIIAVAVVTLFSDFKQVFVRDDPPKVDVTVKVDPPPTTRSGGIDIDSGQVTAGGDIVGRNKIVYAATPPASLPLQRPRRAEHFTGRETELPRITADLQPSRVVTLCGPGGIGKTALAAEAIWNVAPGGDPPDRFPDGIILHTFYTEAQAALALEAIARAYGEDPRPTPADAARRALSRRCALLVLDGAENADDLDAVLAVAGGCGVLITTRRHHDAPGHWHDIAPLPSLKAVELLQAWGGDFAADESAAIRICELVGGLPLAVTLAGKYLAQRQQDAADYLAWLRATPLAALDFGQRQRDSVPVLLERSLAQVTESARPPSLATSSRTRWSSPKPTPSATWASWSITACFCERVSATRCATPSFTPTPASACRHRPTPSPGWPTTTTR